MEVKTVRILAARFPEAKAALDKIIRRARRLGLTDFSYTAGDPYPVEKRRVDIVGRATTYTVDYQDLMVTGAALKIGDHEFLARLEVTPDGVLVDRLPTVTDLDPRFMHTDGSCEHCRLGRDRRHLFVLRDRRSGAQIQVGRQCLRPYLGVDNPAAIAQGFATWGEILGVVDEMSEFGPQVWVGYINDWLQAASVAIKLKGWVSSKMAADGTLAPTHATAHLAMCGPDKASTDHGRRLAEELRAEWRAHAAEHQLNAQQARRWLEEQAADSEYIHNLKVLAARDFFTDPRRVPIVVSLMGSYLRAVGAARTAEHKASAESRPVGDVDARLRDLEVVLEKNILVSENQWGPQYLLKFRTMQGDILCWFTGKFHSIPDGTRCRLTGTVTKHQRYENQMQTMLGRCIVQPIEEI